MSTKVFALHIEDNPGDARLMEEYLREVESVRFDLVVVPSLAQAIERLEAQRFDVVLLDLSLPDAQGLESVCRLSATAPDLPIVVLTGLDDETLAVEAVTVGAQDYLIKGRLDGPTCARALRYAIERHRSRAELRTQSLQDDMTGLYNRRGFLALAEQHVKMAIRERAGVILLFCDLDDLKSINDTYGHSEGDRAIVDAARLLRETLRETDIVGRLGGDEFTVLLLDGNGSGAATILARLRETFDVHNRRSGRPYRLSMSIGVARKSAGTGIALEELLADADRSLYEQKRSGRRRASASTDSVAVSQTGST